MCGIVGIIDPASSPREIRPVIQRMTDGMFHRGLDNEGFFESDDISLGMRRLSNLDLAGGKQAICNEDESIVIVFNGTIYNDLEISAWISSGTRKPHWII